MDRKEFGKKLSAGIFFIASIMLIVGVVFAIGGDKGFMEPKLEMTILYREVGGLTMGSPVLLSGVHVGTVSSVGFLDTEVEGRGVEVKLDMYEKYEKQLRKSTYFAIITEGVLGEKVIEISTDPNLRRKDLSVPIIGEDPLNVENLAVTFGEAAVALLETSQTLETITREIQNISLTTKRLLQRIEQRVIDGNLFKVF